MFSTYSTSTILEQISSGIRTLYHVKMRESSPTLARANTEKTLFFANIKSSLAQIEQDSLILVGSNSNFYDL